MTLRDRLLAWAQLLRLPNLFTVPGDPLAGFAIATLGRDADPRLALLAATSAGCFYLGGLVLNDLLDLAEDRRERPRRPLPSGRVSVPAAQFAVFLLFLAGFALVMPAGRKTLGAAVGLAVLVVAYNSPLRRVPALGPVLMGSCRAASFFLGVVAGYQRDASPVPLLMTGLETLLIYIAGVTLLARQETTGRHPGFGAGLPPAAMVVGLLVVAVLSPPAGAGAWAGFLLAGAGVVVLSVDANRCMRVKGRVEPPMIGQLISALVFWQAAQLFATGRPLWALLILACWPLSRLLARRVYQS